MYNHALTEERASYNGSIEASQASDVGSIPIARSINPDDSVDLARLSSLNSTKKQLVLDGSVTVIESIGWSILTTTCRDFHSVTKESWRRFGKPPPQKISGLVAAQTVQCIVRKLVTFRRS